LTLFCASLAGYAFAQMHFRLSGPLFFYFLLGLLFPAQRRSCRSSSWCATSDYSTA
jgi:ABC-type glycerol-3-phosphate transport system permease component